MARITPKNWASFQHYRDRAPPWIKLHKGLLDDFEFQSLPVASRALAPMLWLLASEHQDGTIDADPKKLAFRLRLTVTEVTEALKPLISEGFFVVVQGDSAALAETERVARPEREAETQEETEKELSAGADAPAFEAFWKDYPTDKNMSKKAALAQWKRLSPEKRAAAIAAVPGFKAYCAANSWYRPVHAERFLSQERFEGYAVERRPPAQVHPSWGDDRAAKWKAALTEPIFDAWFAAAEIIDDADPPVLRFPKPYQRNHVASHFPRQIEKLIGGPFQLVAA